MCFCMYTKVKLSGDWNLQKLNGFCAESSNKIFQMKKSFVLEQLGKRSTEAVCQP